MQDYLDMAAKNNLVLHGEGPCQFCGAHTQRGIHECVEVFNFAFQTLDHSNLEDHLYRFLGVDAHCLQHPEIHGRWNNHFHLTRLHLVFAYQVFWTYQLSPKLSDHLNAYKSGKEDEVLTPPPPGDRGQITTTDIQRANENYPQTKAILQQWGEDVYQTWKAYHPLVDNIANTFLEKSKQLRAANQTSLPWCR